MTDMEAIESRPFRCSCGTRINCTDREAIAAGWNIGCGNGDPLNVCPACRIQPLKADVDLFPDPDAESDPDDESEVEPRGSTATFAIGDIVQLKSGGPSMTIVSIIIGAARGVTAETIHFATGDLCRHQWPLEALAHIQ